ncbi:thioredoxin family protein [Salipaludibacillus agaradhaerens]|uniref:thioredoxin family protein n=1 Tax=Salipaludibacillus agaradhaerens TaxID=76935 RepID=UPI002150B41D|nr:thioredoxin family protein [Salipaludibacillus agaradhaerens]MCR6107410.1 thioredoxin family protein [Salipaludibacillus agaradhaerens]MCR6119439.1 thioredoxin family protein [Salipaludibacillus agaradhaerens]
MKKLIIFGSIIVVLFGAIGFLTHYQNTQTAQGNPFGKKTLHNETVEQLDDPLYQNVILPDELEEKLANGEDATIYFYSGRCEYCNLATPILVPQAEEMGVDLQLFNLLEFEEGRNDYNIRATPMVVHYENGEEVARVEGKLEAEGYERFFEEVVLTD